MINLKKKCVWSNVFLKDKQVEKMPADTIESMRKKLDE